MDAARIKTRRSLPVTHKNRITGYPVTIGHAHDLGLCDGEGANPTNWYTICEEHGHCIGHPTRSIALIWFAHPDEWCEPCMEEITNKGDSNNGN